MFVATHRWFVARQITRSEEWPLPREVTLLVADWLPWLTFDKVVKHALRWVPGCRLREYQPDPDRVGYTVNVLFAPRFCATRNGTMEGCRAAWYAGKPIMAPRLLFWYDWYAQPEPVWMDRLGSELRRHAFGYGHYFLVGIAVLLIYTVIMYVCVNMGTVK